jgi:hypothetical protein
MRKWWKVNRQSSLSEYDETPKGERTFTLSDMGLMAISLIVYLSVIRLTSDWEWYYHYPAACISYIIIYLSLLTGRDIWRQKKKENQLTTTE